ncbi:MAG: hypothetical protein FWD49_04485 [Firmicutes bacterium]|nr:hypothetical protein [Bacillota bacterium]
MSALQKEMVSYIQNISDSKLKLLKPLLRSMAFDETLVVETDLTAEELAIIARGEEERKGGTYIPFNFN